MIDGAVLSTSESPCLLPDPDRRERPLSAADAGFTRRTTRWHDRPSGGRAGLPLNGKRSGNSLATCGGGTEEGTELVLDSARVERPAPTCRRVLLKLSGEALLRNTEFGIERAMLDSVSREVAKIVDIGVQVAMVIGAGNIFRGTGLVETGIERVTADQIGMLGTIVNALALQDAMERHGMTVRVMSAIRVNQLCEEYIRRRAVRHLEKGRVVIVGAGTGNPFFTTDTAASLRAIEIDADLLVKATKVDGVFSADPKRHPDAKRYRRLGYDHVLSKRLAIMDATAVVLARDNDLPLRVVDMNRCDAFLRAVMGEDEGTLVENVPEGAESAI